MKIGIIRLYCGKSGKKGFYNIQEIGLAKSLVKKGIDIDIFFLDHNIKEKYIIEKISKNIRLITIKSKKICNHGFFSLKILNDFKIDIIHLLSDNQIFSPNIIKYCQRKKIPYYCYVGTIESDNSNFIKKKFMDFISKRTLYYYKKSLVICKTEQVQKKLNSKGIINTNIIPVGLDLDIIPQVNESDIKIKEKLGIDNNKKILLFVGRLEEYKKPLKFIELMNYINKINCNYVGIMIGNGSLRKEIIKKVEQYKLQNKIFMIDKVKNEDIHEYYKISDVFINLNDNEIFGMSILEAMYQECPVVAHSAPGPNFIISSGKNGFIINNYDNKIYFNKIENIIGNSNIKINARKKIIEELSWDKISNKFIYLFDQLLEK